MNQDDDDDTDFNSFLKQLEFNDYEFYYAEYLDLSPILAGNGNHKLIAELKKQKMKKDHLKALNKNGKQE